MLGIVRAASPHSYPLLIDGLHTNAALLAIGFAGVHIVTAVVDPFAGLGPVDALVPFVSAYRGTWLGLGVVSGYLSAVAVLTSWPARRLRREWWRWLHRATYLAWILALVHALATGSDTVNRVFLALDLAAVAGVLAVFLGYRVANGWQSMPPLWGALAVIAVLVVVGVAVWASVGPLQAGWARSSGTPPRLLGSH